MVLNCGVGEDSLSPLDCKEIQPVHPKGDQSWVFIGRTDVEAESPILWPPNVKSWLIGKDTDAGKDWGQEKGTTEDKMVGWHSLTQWSWVWVDSGSWWWTGRTAVLWFMGSRRVRHNWVSELNWAERGDMLGSEGYVYVVHSHFCLELSCCYPEVAMAFRNIPPILSPLIRTGHQQQIRAV